MSNKNNKATQIINALTHKDYWRYATISTLSCILAGLVSLFTPLAGLYVFYLILASAAAAFYCYGSTLATQTSMILFGILIGLISCLTTSYLANNLYLSTIALFFISGLLYYYSLKNIGAFFIVKFTLVLTAFSYHPMGADQALNPTTMTLVFLSAGICCSLVNAIYYLLFNNQSKEFNIWENTLIHNLNALRSPFKASSFINLLPLIPSELGDQHALTNHLILEKISIALNKYHNILQADSISASLKAVSQRYFSSITLDNQITSSLNIEEAKSFFFTQALPLLNTHNTNEAELLYLIDKLSDNLMLLHPNIQTPTKQLPSKQASSTFKNVIQALKPPPIAYSSQLSDNVKIAARAMIAIPLSYIIAMQLAVANPAWIILTTNLVLLVRHGDTSKKSFDRISGHICGFIIAIPLFFYLWPLLNTPIFWIPLLVFSCALSLTRNYIAFSIFMMIAIIYLAYQGAHLQLNSHNFFQLAWHRLLDVTYGSLIAYGTSALIFNQCGSLQLKQAHLQIMTKINQTLTLLIKNPKETDLLIEKSNLSKQLTDNLALYNSLLYQPRYYIKNKENHIAISTFEKTLSTQIISLMYRVTTLPAGFSDCQSIQKDITTNLKSLQKIINRYDPYNNDNTIDSMTPALELLLPFTKTLTNENSRYLNLLLAHKNNYQPYLHAIGLNHLLRDISITLRNRYNSSKQ